MGTPGHPFKRVSRGRFGAWKEVHSGAKGGPLGGVDLPEDGGLSGKESAWIRCKQCGFPLNTDGKDQVNPGDDRGNFTFATVTTLDNGTSRLQSATRTGGCDYCGSSNYGDRR